MQKAIKSIHSWFETPIRILLDRELWYPTQVDREDALPPWLLRTVLNGSGLLLSSQHYGRLRNQCPARLAPSSLRKKSGLRLFLISLWLNIMIMNDTCHMAHVPHIVSTVLVPHTQSILAIGLMSIDTSSATAITNPWADRPFASETRRLFTYSMLML